MKDDPTFHELLLEYAQERLKNIDLDPFKKKHPKVNIVFNPKRFEPYPRTEEELKYMLGRQWKVNLCLMGSFFEEYKNITSNYLKNPERPVSILSLSSTSRNLVSIFKSSRNVTRLLDKLRDIRGLVKVRGYRFGTKYGSENYSSAYAYNKSIEKLVLGMIERYKLNQDIHENENHEGRDISLLDIFANDLEKHYNIKVSSKLKIPNCSDEICESILERRYQSLLGPRRRKIEEMNKHLPSEQKISLEWNIHRSPKGFITKIGTRATSRIVSLKEHVSENLDYQGIWRREYLDEQFGRGRWFDYDVHGSIYQLTHLLNTGEWLGNQIDPYIEMFGGWFKSPEERQAYKSLCMTLYFDYATKIVSNNRLRTPNILKAHTKEEISFVLTEAESKMRDFTGETFDSEIFLHESLLYIDFVYALRKKGVRVVQVYDGFYMTFGSVGEDELEETMGECAVSYYQDFKRWMMGDDNMMVNR